MPQAGALAHDDLWARIPYRDCAVVLPFAAVPAAIALDTLLGLRALGLGPFLHAALLALVLITVGGWLRRWLDPPKECIPLLVAFGSFVPAMALASHNPYSSEKVAQLLLLVPVAALGALVVIDRPGRVVGLLWVVGLLGCLIAGLTLLVPDSAGGFGATSALRNTSYISTARIIGNGVVALLALAILARRFRLRLAALAGAAAASPVLILTGSRGPVAAVVVALLVLLAARSRGLGRIVVPGVVVLTVLGGGRALLPYLPADLGTRFEVLVGGSLDVSAGNRIQLALRAVDVIATRPFGLGWGDFGEVVSGYGGAHRLYPHNLILETGAEGGWLALIGLGFLGVAVVRGVIARAADRHVQALSVLLAYSLVNAMVSSDITGNLSVWILAGAVLGATRPLPVDRAVPLRLADVVPTR